MRRGLPLVPTIFFLCALPLLIGLGLWQLQRATWKEQLLRQFATAETAPPLDIGADRLRSDMGFRAVRVILDCPPQKPSVRAGRNRAGQAGFAYQMHCRTAGGDLIAHVIGWSNRPDDDFGPPLKSSNRFKAAGMLVETGRDDPRFDLVSARAVPPLKPVAPPSPDSIPNNHRGYAVQWFAFALVLCVIYGLFVRRWRQGDVSKLAKSAPNG